jgi:hypothetical protein
MFNGENKNHNADIAQLVEHLICNQDVAGSTPVIGSNKNKSNKTCILFLMLYICILYIINLKRKIMKNKFKVSLYRK